MSSSGGSSTDAHATRRSVADVVREANALRLVGRLAARLCLLSDSMLTELEVDTGLDHLSSPRKKPALKRAEDLARLCCSSPRLRSLADSFLAERSPLPTWCLTRAVLLHADLLTLILSSLEAPDCAAAGTCTAWRAAWLASDGGRRGLRPGHALTPDFEQPSTGTQGYLSPINEGDQIFIRTMAIPDSASSGVHMLCVQSSDEHGPDALTDAYALDEHFRVECRLDDLSGVLVTGVAVSDDSIYTAGSTDSTDFLVRYDLTTHAEKTRYDPGEEDTYFADLAVSSTSPRRVFMIIHGINGVGVGLKSLDAYALEPSSTTTDLQDKGDDRSPLLHTEDQVLDMVCGDDELFILSIRGLIIVLSLYGTYKRTIRSELWACSYTSKLAFTSGRLYLLGGYVEHGDRTSVRSDRVFVLTPQGEPLQSYGEWPGRTAPSPLLYDICALPGRLVVRGLLNSLRPEGPSSTTQVQTIECAA